MYAGGFGHGAMMRGYGPGMMFRDFGERSLYCGSYPYIYGIISFLIFIGVIILVFKLASKSGTNKKHLEVLKMRFAKGEITEQEFIAMKKALRGK